MYRYSNYQKVKEMIEARRLASLASKDARDEEVRELSEGVRAIDERLKATGLLLFKTACTGGDIEPIKKENLKLQEMRRDLIEALGFPRDYTDLKYYCPDCSDTGYIGGTKVCHCLKEALIRETIASSGIGDLLDKQTFESFDLEWYRYDEKTYELMKRNVNAAKAFVRDFGSVKKNLLLIGTTGSGKTHISTAIAGEVIRKGYDVIYDSAVNIIRDFNDDQFHRDGKEEPKSDKYMECDLLIIDDLGTEFVTAFSVSCLYNLLNTRQNRSLPTVISTNLTADELSGKYEDRIYSRIVGAGCTILLFNGKDHRIG